MLPPRCIAVVSGLPRAGTSLVMQMLAAGGLPPLTDRHRAADESNPRGYYEDERVKRLRTDRAFLAEAPGHAVKIIHLLLPELPTDAGYTFRVLFLRRNLDEVLASQRAMLARTPSSAAPPLDTARLAAVFTAQLAKADAFLRAHPAVFTALDVAHHDLLTDPAAGAARLNVFLGGSLDAGKMAGVVDGTLWRQRLPG